MRYVDIENITFTDINGNSFEIKDIRPIPEQQLLTSLKLSKNDFIDEIASRPSIYGDGAEDLTFKIVDLNIIKIVESKFNFDNIRTLKIPNLG